MLHMARYGNFALLDSLHYALVNINPPFEGFDWCYSLLSCTTITVYWLYWSNSLAPEIL